MASLDTSCLLRWLIGDQPDQARAVDDLIRREGRVVVPDAVLLEAVFVMSGPYGLSRADVAAALAAVLGEGAMAVDVPLWSAVTQDYLAHPKLSVVDVYLAHLARGDHDEPLFTFDRKLAAQMAGTELVRPG